MISASWAVTMTPLDIDAEEEEKAAELAAAAEESELMARGAPSAVPMVSVPWALDASRKKIGSICDGRRKQVSWNQSWHKTHPYILSLPSERERSVGGRRGHTNQRSLRSTRPN